MSPANVEERIARLEALGAIGDLKARYAALADAKYTPAHERVLPERWRNTARMQAECFTENAQWFGGDLFGGTLQGRDALTEWFTRSPWRFALHYYVAPALTLRSNDTASGTWRLWQVGIPLDSSAPVILAGTTVETYRRTHGEWLIESMQFDEIHTIDLNDSPAVLKCVLARVDS
jgi:hypothetical protein